ncbi:MAG: GNAT family protein [Microscillaceae bacterium]|nr:GNAT family protein [Microscillaceae bacterium]
MNIHIHTSRLLIRNLSDGDLLDFYAYRSNPEVTKYQSFDVMTLDQSDEFIQDQKDQPFGDPGEWTQYGIEQKSNAKLIGDCAIKLDAYDARIAEIGITISHQAQKKGYAKEAFMGILDFLFNRCGVHRVVEYADVENTASNCLLKSLGFRLEGHLIESLFVKGKWINEYQYAMLKREWDKLYSHHKN